MLNQYVRSTQFASVLALVTIFSMVGCRTTTTKLASVPGMGWLDRGEKSFGEGWAGYEPAPELPRPSSTSEPTNSGSTANIAKTDPVPGAGKYADSTNRFDAARYTPAGFGKQSSPEEASVSRNAGSTYGDYASAYGKYGPGGAIEKETVGVQNGPYGSTASRTSGSNASNAYDATASTTASSRFDSSKDSPFTKASNPTTDSRYGGADDAAAYTASSDSRFGGSAYASKPKNTLGTQTAPSTYTPPGFPTNEFSTKAADTASRFGDDAQDVASSSIDKASRFAAAATSPSSNSVKPNATQTGGLINSYATQARQTATNTVDQAKSTVNSATNSTVQGYAAAAQETAQDAQQSLSNQVDEYTSQLSNRFDKSVGGIAETTQSRINQSTNSTIDQAAETTGRYVDAIANGAQEKIDSYANTPSAAGGYVQTAQEQLGRASDVVSEYTSAGTDYVNKAANAVQERYNNVASSPAMNTVKGYVQTAQNAAQDYTTAAPNQDSFSQPRGDIEDYAAAGTNYANQLVDKVQNSGSPTAAYPSTNTPNGYPSTGTPNPYDVNPVSDQPLPNATPNAYVPTTPVGPATSPIRRSAAPWRPGGTSDLQGSTKQTTFKQEIATARPTPATPGADHLVLAVGDKYDFPRMLR